MKNRLYINKSKVTHLLEIRNDPMPLSVPPMGVVDADTVITNVRCIDSFVPFDVKKLKDLPVVTIQRDYALGDLIQLIPVVRYYKKHNNIEKIYLKVSSRFRPTLSRMFKDLVFIDTNATLTHAYGPILNLNGVLENDHSVINDSRLIHRINIYTRFLFGGDIPKEELDWSHTMNEERKLLFNENEKVIGIQIRGSGKMKTLPFDFIKLMSKSLVEKGYKVLLIDQSKTMGFEGEGIINACGQMDALDIVKNLGKCVCVITMDSGVLWLAHVAKCPVITFLGPTREHERLTLHPLYPYKAKGIDLAKDVGCEPCFETRVNCKGKINCMNAFNYDRILNKVFENLNIIVDGEKNE